MLELHERLFSAASFVGLGRICGANRAGAPTTAMRLHNRHPSTLHRHVISARMAHWRRLIARVA